MKRPLLLTLLAALLISPLGWIPAQEESQSLDGTVWSQLSSDHKSLYTLGYFNGISVFAKFVPGSCTQCTADCLEEASSRLIAVGMGIPAVVEIVDQIYVEEANHVIPVLWAMKLAAQKAQGIQDDEYQTAILEAREESGG